MKHFGKVLVSKCTSTVEIVPLLYYSLYVVLLVCLVMYVIVRMLYVCSVSIVIMQIDLMRHHYSLPPTYIVDGKLLETCIFKETLRVKSIKLSD